MRFGPFIIGKTCWSFNEGGRFLTLSLMRFGVGKGWGVRLWVHGHALNASWSQGKPTFSHHYNRVGSKREVMARTRT